MIFEQSLAWKPYLDIIYENRNSKTKSVLEILSNYCKDGDFMILMADIFLKDNELEKCEKIFKQDFPQLADYNLRGFSTFIHFLLISSNEDDEKLTLTLKTEFTRERIQRFYNEKAFKLLLCHLANQKNTILVVQCLEKEKELVGDLILTLVIPDISIPKS